MSVNGYELGGNASRSSVDWIGYDPSINEEEVFVHNNPELDSTFAYENGALSGNWNPFYFPNGIGLPAYSYPITESISGNNPPASVVKSSDCGRLHTIIFTARGHGFR